MEYRTKARRAASKGRWSPRSGVSLARQSCGRQRPHIGWPQGQRFVRAFHTQISQAKKTKRGHYVYET
jgi:hypothetical protein